MVWIPKTKNTCAILTSFEVENSSEKDEFRDFFNFRAPAQTVRLFPLLLPYFPKDLIEWGLQASMYHYKAPWPAGKESKL